MVQAPQARPEAGPKGVTDIAADKLMPFR